MVKSQKRREVLIGGSTAVIALLSGCGGYTIKKTHRIDQLRSDLQNKKEQTSELEIKLESSKAEIESLNQTLSKKENEINQLEEDLHTSRAKQVLYFYANGIAEYNKGDKNWSRASSSAGDDDYADAALRLGAAFAHYNAARYTFSSAESRAKDHDFNQVISYIEEAEMKSKKSAKAANYYGQAYEHYAREEYDEGDDDYETGKSAYNQLGSYTLYDLDKLENTLSVEIEV
jgi:septal ring factor EnvC (AmiA/AmiB activator)